MAMANFSNLMAVHFRTILSSPKKCFVPYNGGCLHYMLLTRPLTNATKAETKLTEDIRKIGIPLVPKKKDPNAVLKALASAVDSSPDHLAFMGRSDADPYAPRNRRQMLDYLMAQEAGRRAGDYVINRFPKLFPGRMPNPNLGPWRPSWKGLNEDSLWEYIKARKVAKALDTYQELIAKGHAVSQESKNGILALLAFVGIGNTPLMEPLFDGQQQQQQPKTAITTNEGADIVEPVEEIGSTANVMSDKKPRRKLLPLKALWSLENEAEKMFASMEEKDGMTYGAMIQGLTKYGEYKRAQELFEEARKRDLQLSLTTYNQLLSALLDSNQTKLWDKAMTIVSNMSSSPLVQPDITTINLLLMFAHTTGTKARQNSIEVIREMNHLGLKPTLTTFLRLLDCFMKNRDTSILYPIVNYLEKNSTEILQLKEYSDVDFFPYAMLGARVLRDVSLAKRLNNLAKKDQWYLVGALETFLSHYLFVSSFEMKIEKLFEEYQLVVPRLFVPKEWLYLMMFKKCESERRPDIALALWQNMMKNRAYVTNIDVLNRLMGAFTRSFNPEDISQYIDAAEDVWNKLNYLDVKPSPLILSVTIKLYTLDNQLDKAWKYFDLFKEYNMKPTFLAVHALLKAYYSFCDRDKVMELLEIMIDNNLFLPLSFVRDVCHKVQVPDDKKVYFLKEFEKNKSKSHFDT